MKSNLSENDIRINALMRLVTLTRSEENELNYLRALEKPILKIKSTSNARKVIRGDMFRLCNLLGNGTNTIFEDNNEI